MRYILPSLQTGDTQSVIYDLTNNYMYYAHGILFCFFSNQLLVGLEGVPNRQAFNQPFTRLDMTKIFAEPHP